MSSGGDYPTPDTTIPVSPSSVPLVSTIQAVRSPIWSVPTLSEGHLNVGGSFGVCSSTADSLPTVGAQVSVHTAGEIPSSLVSPSLLVGSRRVVVKQLPPKEQSGSSTKASGLAQLATQLPSLTAQQAQSILASMRSLSSAQHLQAATLTQPQAHPPPAPSQPSQPLKLAKGKPIAPKQHHGKVANVAPFPPPSHRMASTSKTAPMHVSQQPTPVPTQKVVAPVAVPPPCTIPASVSMSHEEDLGPFSQDPTSTVPSMAPHTITTSKPRKPCNCKNSQCLKLYCDCFANGEFCREGCHCHNCKNNMEHAEERAKAVKTCLDRNPHAFKPKVGQKKAGDERRHIRGCNCKRSGCLKNYCECYEAKIACSSLCRCVGCKNVVDKLESKSLMQLADAADIRTQQQRAATSHFLEQLELTTTKPQTRTQDGQRLPFSFINKEVAKATCLCLLEEASHAIMYGNSGADVERAVLEEFGRCMTQIINSAQTASSEGQSQTMPVY